MGLYKPLTPATTTTKGVVRLAGGLAGTASAPRRRVYCAFSVYPGSATAIAVNSPTKVGFYTQIFDLGGDFDLSTGTFTAPVDGFYWFGAQLELTTSTKRAFLKAHKNGAVYRRGLDLTSTTQRSTQIQFQTHMTAGDTMEIYAQTSDGADVSNVTASNVGYFQGCLIGET